MDFPFFPFNNDYAGMQPGVPLPPGMQQQWYQYPAFPMPPGMPLAPPPPLQPVQMQPQQQLQPMQEQRMAELQPMQPQQPLANFLPPPGYPAMIKNPLPSPPESSGGSSSSHFDYEAPHERIASPGEALAPSLDELVQPFGRRDDGMSSPELQMAQPSSWNLDVDDPPVQPAVALAGPPTPAAPAAMGVVDIRTPLDAVASSSRVNETRREAAARRRAEREAAGPSEAQTKRGLKRKRDEEEAAAVRAACSIVANPDYKNPYAYAQGPTPDLFCKVVGHLAVVGHQKQYSVFTDEIFRRTSMPECLNRTHLGPLLRRGKIKGCSSELGDLLKKQGLTADHIINRKRYPLNSLSALLEEEAVALCTDHNEIVLAHFPFVPIARLLVRGFSTPAQIAVAAAECRAAKSIMNEFAAVITLWTDGGWGGGYGSRETALISPLGVFARATHGLGIEEVRTWSVVLARFIDTLCEECEAQLTRVRQAADPTLAPYVSVLTQFPPGTVLPKIPKGELHQPDMEEECRSNCHFAEVTGRLTLSNRHFNITVGEILRRARAPESLNLSLLSCLLRMGKTTDNVNKLKEKLKEQGVEISVGRRKSAPVTGFTAITEGEALVLAADVDDLVKKTFPFPQLAEELAFNMRANADKRHTDYTPDQCEQRSKAFAAVARIANILAENVRGMRLVVSDRIPHRIATQAYHMKTYCALTHGYGPDAAISWMNTWSETFGTAAKLMGRDDDDE